MSMEPGRPLHGSAFSGDDGSADPTVVAALSAYAAGAGGSADVLAALAAGRLLVPVVAVLDEAENGTDGLTTDKSSHMATVSTTGKDGRRGLLAFTSAGAMREWNPAARPVPVATRRAAESALVDGADALVIDLAGPVTFSVDADELRALAAGWRPVGDGQGGTAWAVAVGLAGGPASVADSGSPKPGVKRPGRIVGRFLNVLRGRAATMVRRRRR